MSCPSWYNSAPGNLSILHKTRLVYAPRVTARSRDVTVLSLEPHVQEYRDGGLMHFFHPYPILLFMSTSLMALNTDDINKLIRQLEADRQAYLSSHNKLQEALFRILPHQAESGPSHSPNTLTPQGPGTPLLQLEPPTPSIYGLSSFTAEPVAERPGSITSKKPTSGRKVTSVYSAEDSSDSEEGETFFAQNPLPTESFAEEELRHHVQSYPWNEFSKLILGDFRRSGILHQRESIFAPVDGTSPDADHNHTDVYEVGEDGAPLKRERNDANHSDLATWDSLRFTNVDQDRRQAVGRIIIMREPKPVLFAALHLTMNKHFDMDSIYEILIDDTTSTKAYIKGHSMQDSRRQRSIIFAFHYHTLVGKDRNPLHFQNHDPDVNDKDEHLPLSTCSSVLALSMSGPPLKTYRRHSRRNKVLESNVHDPFAPWHLLSIQAFPDWHSEVNLHETHHHYVNGADAFLTTLIHEYRDAVKRFRDLTARIGKLSTPLKEIIFNSQMRDNLLFETGDFVWSRRYFWAAQTLGILSDEIDTLIQAYKDTFTDEVWAGEHKTLFPGTSDTSARYLNWRKKMHHQRKLLEREIENLKDIRRFCDREQKDIKGLREWLFSGTSVQESRKAVEQASITVDQGYNIKLLTLVTIFFLPLTFCTSVYGMSTINPDEGFIKFGAVVTAICIPTYLLIGIINYRTFQKTVAYLGWPVVWTLANTRKGMDWAYKYRDQYMLRKKPKQEQNRTMTRAQTFASLHHRLSMEREEEVQERAGKVDSGNGEIAVPEKLVQRESTIKWDVPSSPRRTPEPSPTTSVPELTREGEVQAKREPESPRKNLLRKLSLKRAGEDAKSPV